MSLSWRKHLRVALCAERLIAGEHVIPVERAAHGEPWRAAVEALPQALGNGTERIRSRLTVVLANEFVRYALLPWNATLKTDEQWLALARHRLSLVHGAAVADWDVRIAHAAPHSPRVVAAADRELLRALDAKAAQCGALLGSVQPYLMTAFNALRLRPALAFCWLVIEEPRRLTLALLRDGEWLALRSRRADERWRSVLPELLERESALLGLEPCRQAFVCAEPSFETPAFERFKLETVDYRALAASGA